MSKTPLVTIDEKKRSANDQAETDRVAKNDLHAKQHVEAEALDAKRKDASLKARETEQATLIEGAKEQKKEDDKAEKEAKDKKAEEKTKDKKSEGKVAKKESTKEDKKAE